MKGKVLLIDFDCRDRVRERCNKWFSLGLFDDEYQISEFYCKNFDFGSKSEDLKLNIDKAVELAGKFDVVFVHFGSMPRIDAREALGRFKATGVKVIVESVSSVLFEAADYIYFMDAKELCDNVKRFCQEKNRS